MPRCLYRIRLLTFVYHLLSKNNMSDKDKKKFSFEKLKKMIAEELFYREFFRSVDEPKEDQDGPTRKPNHS